MTRRDASGFLVHEADLQRFAPRLEVPRFEHGHLRLFDQFLGSREWKCDVSTSAAGDHPSNPRTAFSSRSVEK